MRLLVLLPLALCLFGSASGELASKIDDDLYTIAQDRRYLLYDVNLGEGFNLRRDVYMRVANLVRQLREAGANWILVLPPWGRLYHWQTEQLGYQSKLPWSLFFDLDSLGRFVPVVEFEQFLREYGKEQVEHIYYLQHYTEGWKAGEWQEKWDYRSCVEAMPYEETEKGGAWRGWFFGYENVRALRLDCISAQGHARTLLPLFQQKNLTALSVMIDRAETVMHDHFGDVHYWRARRSMRYAKPLRDVADEFRQVELASNDIDDGTLLAEDWRDMKVKAGQAKGGPFLGVHWRRKDFVRAHGAELPSIEGAARQIEQLLANLSLSTVFLATDAPANEVAQLKDSLPQNVRLKQFVPSDEVLAKYKDGGVSIIDQWICAHARYFIGSHVSTFSFRIQDEREILGFAPNTTFNRLCPDAVPDCEQPAKWTLVQ